MQGQVGRRVPLDRSMLPNIFDRHRSAYAQSRQGSQPDTNLTPTATLSEEIQPAWAPDPTLERLAFASNGVDEDGLPGIDPGVTTLDGTYNIWVMRADGSQQHFEARVRIDTPQEFEYYRNGGILHYVLRQLAA